MADSIKNDNPIKYSYQALVTYKKYDNLNQNPIVKYSLCPEYLSPPTRKPENK